MKIILLFSSLITEEMYSGASKQIATGVSLARTGHVATLSGEVSREARYSAKNKPEWLQPVMIPAPELPRCLPHTSSRPAANSVCHRVGGGLRSDSHGLLLDVKNGRWLPRGFGAVETIAGSS